MLNNTHQSNDGSGNTNVGGNYTQIFQNGARHPLQFNPIDLSNVIDCFSSNLNADDTKLYDLKKVSCTVKNEINSLGHEYYQTIEEHSVPYFAQIDDFLKDHKNKALRKKYEQSVVVLNRKIIAHRSDFDSFEKILDHIAEDMYSKCCHLQGVSQFLVDVFLHYMYCNCDIGKK